MNTSRTLGALPALLVALAWHQGAWSAPPQTTVEGPLTVITDPGADGKLSTEMRAARNTFEDKFKPATILREGFSGADYDVDGDNAADLIDTVPNAFAAPSGKGKLSLLEDSNGDPIGAAFIEDPKSAGASGRFDTTCQWLESGNDCPKRWFETNASFLIDFGGSFNGFGFFGTDYGDFGGTLGIQMRRGTDFAKELIVPLSGTGNASLAFVGYFDPKSLFDGVLISITQGKDDSGNPRNDFFGFDDVFVGLAADTEPPPLPEPATLMLTAVALLALAGSRRRR